MSLHLISSDVLTELSSSSHPLLLICCLYQMQCSLCWFPHISQIYFGQLIITDFKAIHVGIWIINVMIVIAFLLIQEILTKSSSSDPPSTCLLLVSNAVRLCQIPHIPQTYFSQLVITGFKAIHVGIGKLNVIAFHLIQYTHWVIIIWSTFYLFNACIPYSVPLSIFHASLKPTLVDYN